MAAAPSREGGGHAGKRAPPTRSRSGPALERGHAAPPGSTRGPWAGRAHGGKRGGARGGAAAGGGAKAGGLGSRSFSVSAPSTELRRWPHARTPEGTPRTCGRGGPVLAGSGTSRVPAADRGARFPAQPVGVSPPEPRCGPSPLRSPGATDDAAVTRSRSDVILSPERTERRPHPPSYPGPRVLGPPAPPGPAAPEHGSE